MSDLPTGPEGSQGAGGEDRSGLLASLRLMRACHQKDRAEALAALDEGADPNRAISSEEGKGLPKISPVIPFHYLFGPTPLMLAAQRGCAVIALDLLLRGADPEAVDAKGRPALHYAASSGDCDTINALLLGGARADAVDGWGDGALACAAYERAPQPEAVALLIEAGASWAGIGPEGEEEARQAYESWDPSGQSKWSLDEGVRGLLSSAQERLELEGWLKTPKGGGAKAL